MPAKKAKKVSKKSSRKVARSSKMEMMPMQKTVDLSSRPVLKNPRFWVGALVIVLAIFAFLFKGLFIAAIVNGQPISRLSVVSALEHQSGKQALSSLISEDLILQEANRRHINVSQSDIDSDIKKIETTLKSQGVTLDQALLARGLTRNDLVLQIKVQKLLTKIVGQNVKVTADDISSYIDKNKDTLPQDLSDDQLRSQVKQQLEQQQLQDKTQTLIADLQKKASIQYFVNY